MEKIGKLLRKRDEIFNHYIKQIHDIFNMPSFEEKNEYDFLNDLTHVTPNNKYENVLFFLKTMCNLYIYSKSNPKLFNEHFQNTEIIKTCVIVNQNRDNKILEHKTLPLKVVLKKFNKLVEEIGLDPIFYDTRDYITYKSINITYDDIISSKVYDNFSAHNVMNLQNLKTKLEKDCFGGFQTNKTSRIEFSRKNHNFVFRNFGYIPVYLHGRIGKKIQNYDSIMMISSTKKIYDTKNEKDSFLKTLISSISNKKKKRVITLCNTKFYTTYLILFKKEEMENFYDFLVTVGGLHEGLNDGETSCYFLAKDSIEVTRKIIDFYNLL